MNDTWHSGDIDAAKAELIAAGWIEQDATTWRAPDGSRYRGPAGAWRMMKHAQNNAPRRRDHVQAVEFNRVELDHLLTTLRDEIRQGHYYGIQKQYRGRQDRLWRKLEAAYRELTGADGYPLKPSKV